MDGGLAALRLRQREGSRRRKEEERRKRKTQLENGGGGSMASSPSSMAAVRRTANVAAPFGGSPGRSVASGRAGGGDDHDDDDDIQSVLTGRAAALRKRRLEAEREKKNKAEGMDLIRQLYPGLAPPPARKAEPRIAPKPSPMKRRPPSPDASRSGRRGGGNESSSVPKISKRSVEAGRDGGWVSRASKKKSTAQSLSDDESGEKEEPEPRSSKASKSRIPEGNSQGSGSSQDSQSAPIRSVLVQRERSGGENASQLTNPPSPAKPRGAARTASGGAASRLASPSKKVLFQRRRGNFGSDSSEDDLVALSQNLAKKKNAERKRRAEEDDAETDDLTRTAKKLEAVKRRERERKEREERRKKRLEDLKEKARKQKEQMDGDRDGDSGNGDAMDVEPPISPVRTYRRRLYESDSDEDDLVALSLKLGEEKKEKEEKERKRNPITVMKMKEKEMKDRVDSYSNSAKRKKRRSEDRQGDDDRERRSSSDRERKSSSGLQEEDDRKGRTKPAIESDDDNRPEDGQDSIIEKSKKAVESGSSAMTMGKKFSKAVESDVGDDIWDDRGSDRDSIVDSDTDDDDPKPTGRSRKTKEGGWNHKRQRNKAASGEKSVARRSGPQQPGRKRPRPTAAIKSPSKKDGATDLRSLIDSHYDSARSESDSDDEERQKELEIELRNKLRPHFENPKLGVGPLEALELELPEAQEERGPLCCVPYSEEEGTEAATGGNVEGISNESRHIVPASINRYLQPYQREGIAFVHSLLVRGKGCILGDDMGLGKTVQMISVLAALQGKTGTALDEHATKRRQRCITAGLTKEHERMEMAMLSGDIAGARPCKAGEGEAIDYEAKASENGRILIVVPSSVIQNWSNEFDAWGHFSVACYQGEGRFVSLDRVKHGLDDVLIVSRSLFSRRGKGGSNGPFEEINSLRWRLVVVDEVHEYKNHKSLAYECLAQLRTDSRCPVVGMTGTVVQNNYQELWNLVDLVQPGLMGGWKEFQQQTAKPLMMMRTKTAQHDVLELGKRRQADLDRAMKLVYIQRYKKDVLRDELTEKKEQVIFCPLSDVQRAVYRQVMYLPDYHLLRSANAPCDCGVNRNYFLGYKKCRNKMEQIEYEHRKRKELVRMKQCCYQQPWNPRKDEPDEPLIDPEAVIWRNMHPDGVACAQCPTCILLPALHKLYKVSSHAALLQAEKDPNRLEEDTAEWNKARKELEFAQVALPQEVLPSLPGGGHVRQDGIMDNHMALSGKMKRLDEYLRFFSRGHNRVLVFSYSTKTLDLIQHYVRAQGYSFRRLDGKVPTKKRQAMIDEFQRDDTIFLFLISTKAGGLGLNLTAANKVIVFDVNWNPSYDEQAQDRAFRIGQNRDVEVVRLVAQGTVEELMYIRQIYKVHLKMQALGTGKTDEIAGDGSRSAQPRIFRGVAGDSTRKGELFGLENLLKFKDGSFMAELWTAKEKTKRKTGGKQSGSLGIIDVSTVANALSSMTDDQVDRIGAEDDELPNETSEKATVNHADFMWDNRGEALLKPGDEGFEEEMGGASQIVHVMSKMACEHITVDDDDTHDSDNNDKLAPTVPTVKPVSPNEQLEAINETNDDLGKDGRDEVTALLKEIPMQETPSKPSGKVTATVEREMDSAANSPARERLNQSVQPSTPVAKKSTAPEVGSTAAPAKTFLLGKKPADGANPPKPNLLGILHVPSYSKKKKKKKRTQPAP